MEYTERTNHCRNKKRRADTRSCSRVLLRDRQAGSVLFLTLISLAILWESGRVQALQNTLPPWTRSTATKNCFQHAFWSHRQPSQHRVSLILYDSETHAEVGLSTITDEQRKANGATAPPHINGATEASDLLSSFLTNQTIADDAPRPTANGGYTHTNASKAKISAANKGKIPWNKGRQRSPEERARIAAGVRARNRQRFLQKLKDMGLTEEEYEQQKREERRKKEAERRARRTENGGYRPTEETKRKISQILKQKYASGEFKPRKVDPAKVRRGFKHTEETRQKISESLRRRWADDEDYRAHMLAKSTYANSKEDVRRRISDSLRKKWQDPEFRAEMMTKMSNRVRTGLSHDLSHREKISRAMKAKWQDEEYRKKTLDSIQKRKEAMAKLRPPKVVRKEAPKKKPLKKVPIKSTVDVAPPSTSTVDAGVMVIEPIQEPRKPRTRRKTVKGEGVTGLSATSKRKTPKKTAVPKPTSEGSSKDEKPEKKRSRVNGDKSLLREQRRDLYDLLYGDEDEDEVSISSNPLSGGFQLGDENLDTFDPYGLEDS